MSSGATTKRKIRLVQPDTAFDENGKKGSWTMIYDEGFEVAVGNEVFFAFSRFDWVNGPSGKTNVSQCNHTQVGWYRNLARTRWGCYVGRKVGATDEEAAENVRRVLATQLAQASQASQTASQAQDQDAEAQARQDVDTARAPTTSTSQDPVEVDSASTTTDDSFAQQQAALVQAAAQDAASTQDAAIAAPVAEVDLATDVESTTTIALELETAEAPALESTTEASTEASVEAASETETTTEAATEALETTTEAVAESSFTEASTTESASVSATESATDTDGAMAVETPTANEDQPEKFGESRLLEALQAVDDSDVDDDAATTTTTTTTTATTTTTEDVSPADSMATVGEDSTGGNLGHLGDSSSYDSPAAYTAWRPGQGYDRPMDQGSAQSVADALNFLQLGWRAAAYERYHGKSPREMNRLAGVRRGRSERGPAAAQGESFLSVRTRHRHRRHAAHTKDLSSFDWRNKDGKNWLTEVVTQGDCGSCYTISTVHMLTARNKIRAGEPTGPLFSVSFPLYCAEYNQGCDGGYGFLQSKWSEDVGLVPEECAPFSEGGGHCAVTAGCSLGSKRYRAVNHHYVGGFYGGSDEESIKQELLRGPLVMSFEPSEDFMYYKSGVYRSGPHKIHEEWEQVDHAVLLVAFGRDGQKPYWTMQNSWGTDWGEEGYFRMARGIDESGCESIVVAADVAEEASNSVLDDFVAQLRGN